MRSKLAFLSTIFVLLLMSGCTKEEIKNDVNSEVAKVKEATEATEETLNDVKSDVETEVENAENKVEDLEQDGQEAVADIENGVEQAEDSITETVESTEESVEDAINGEESNDVASTEEAVNEAEASFETTDESTVSEEVAMPEESVEDVVEVTVPEKQTVHFGFRSYTLDNTAGLDEVANFLKEHSHYRANISGYTDISGDAQFNVFLSQKRADFVKEYLISLGVEESQLDSKGHGATNFISANERASENRRVEIEVIE
jgi:outer membrane protein OmpA-like peptidoglycan-associated protein